ncbi:MAG: sugar transferase, partial [Thermodesulfobacteriota bacterium]
LGTVAQEISDRERLGFHLVGNIDYRFPEHDGCASEIGEYIDRLNCRIDLVVVAFSERRGKYPVDELVALKVQGYDVVEWQHFVEKISGRIPVRDLSPSYIIFNPGFEKKYLVLLSRRIMSFLVAFVALALLFPLLIVICLIIRRDSPGPVFFLQPRVGEKGSIFSVIKFRTMVENAEKIPVEIRPGEEDPRITRAGCWLRRYRIDEIPQLINIIKGDINIIGPRPLIVYHVKEYGKNIPYFGLRQTIKPGITGWAQVMFHHSDTLEEFETKMEYDLYYLKNMSIKLDLLILMKTTKIVLLGRGAK